MKDEVVLAAQKQMGQETLDAVNRLRAAYRETVVAYTKARQFDKAQAVQDEYDGKAPKPAATDTAAATGTAAPTPTAAPTGTAAPVTPTKGVATGADAGFPAPALPEGATQVALAGPATAVAVGGSGRYLILQIGKLQQLAVFDVSQVKVVKYLPMPTNNLVFAAGAKKLFVGLKDLRQIQRWDLTKLDLELTVPAPDPVGAMAMGACATTPLLMVGDGTKRYWVINPMTLKGEAFPSQRWGGGGGGAWGPVNLHVSFDGSTSVACGGGWAGIEVGSLSAAGKVVNVHSGSYVNGDTLIAGNGVLVFPSQGGILRSDLVSKVTGIDGTPFPADDPAFSLAYRNDKGKAVLVLYANADPRPLVTFQDLPEITKDSALPLEQRIHLIPRAKALVTVGEGGDRLVLRKFDLAESLEAEGVDYLFVESPPVISVDKGMRYTYQMKVRSKKGGVKTELQSGPKGMTVSKTGLVQWTAPTKVDDPHPTVIIQVTDDSGQTIFHTFSINVIDPAASKAGPR